MTISRQHGSEGNHRRWPSTPREALNPSTPAPPGVYRRPARGPVPAGQLTGRETQREEVSRLITTHRVVTLTGPPGVGKTRLASHVVAQLPRPQKIFVVDIGPVTDPVRLPEVVAAELGLVVGADLDPLDGLATRLGDASILVVLDNCEHLVAACAELVGHLVRRCRGLRVLTTSQEALRVAGESIVPVPPLSLPGLGQEALPELYLGSDAVQLFCDRAAAVQPGFLPTPETASAIAEICRRLDGLPLAIELAAARLTVLSLDEILAGLDDRFTLLSSPGREAGSRHRSLRAALDRSYGLLSPSERVLLGRLSVFPGGCTFDAAEEVCTGHEIRVDDLVDVLGGLVAKSVVVADTATRSARYRLTESIRAYAAGRLAQAGETAEMQARQGRWCVQFLDRAPRQPAAAKPEWLARLECEEENLFAALGWAVADGRLRTSLALVGRVVPFWWARGRYREAQRWLERVLGVDGPAPAPLRTKLLCDAGLVAVMLGEFAVARPRLEEALALATEVGDSRGRIDSLKALGFVSTFEGDPRHGLTLIEEAVALARTSGEGSALAHALATRARAHLLQGHAQRGLADFEESMVAAHGIDRLAVANARVGIGWAALCLGRYVDAERQLDVALSSAREMDDRHTVSLALSWLGELGRLRGNDAEARSRFEECARLATEMSTPYPLGRALLGLGRLAQANGDSVAARRHLEEALTIVRASSIAHLASPCLAALGELAQAEGQAEQGHQLLDEALAAARRCGDQTAEGQALYALGCRARTDGDRGRAASLHHQALTLRAEIDDVAGIADSLEALGGLAVERGTFDDAVRIFGAARSVRDAWGCVRPALHAGDCDRDVEVAQRSLGGEAYDIAWAQGAVASIEEAVRYASRRRGRRPRASLGWDALTASEHQVVDLVAEGLTNPEIAQRLCVSARTVQTHLRHVFAKLGVTSRTAVAGEVMRRTAEQPPRTGRNGRMR